MYNLKINIKKSSRGPHSVTVKEVLQRFQNTSKQTTEKRSKNIYMSRTNRFICPISK